MYDLAGRYCFHLDQDNTKDGELFLLLLSLEKYVNGAIIEMNRLERTRRNIDKESILRHNMLRQNIYTPGKKRKDFRLTYLGCDTHFFFICIDKCYKLIAQFSLELHDNEIRKLETELDRVFDIAVIRNHLEHIEERCRGYLSRKDEKQKMKKHIADFGNFVGDDFSFDGKEYRSDKKSLEKLENIYLRLVKILDDRARKDPEFVKETKNRERNELVLKAWTKWSRLQKTENSPPNRAKLGGPSRAERET